MRARGPFVRILPVIALLFVATSASALSIVSQRPTMATWEHRTAWPVRVVFDASLDTPTVTPASFFVTVAGTPADPIPGAITFETTTLADDTIVFTPTDPWRLGTRYEIHATADIESTGNDPFDENIPDGDFAANVPMDMDRPDYDPGDPFSLFINANVLAGFDVADPESTNPNAPWTIPGMGATEAWKYTAGRPDVIVAVIDNGLEIFNNKELWDRLFLNAGELPLPMDGPDECVDWDCNDDGRFSVSDYANDARVPAPPAGYPLSPAELIIAFADDVDGDGNGLVDDISGWDFLRRTPDPIGIDEWPEGAHGDARARDVCAMADNGDGDKPGFCPDCTILPIRVSDAIIASHNAVGAGIRYAADMGAQIAVAASGTPDYSWTNEEAVLDALDAGMFFISVAGDELGFHHSFPAAGEDVFTVKSIFPIPNIDLLGLIPMNIVAYTETYCTNYNEHVHVAASSGACSSEAAGNTAGLAGLVLSRAYDLGLDLSPNEMKQLITMTSDDIADRCVTLTGGGCQEGFEKHFGYGRPNLRKTFEALGSGADHRIPPEVRITSPRWWALVDPLRDGLMSVEGEIYARGEPFTYEVQVARGGEPLDGEFATIASGNGEQPVSGAIAEIDPLTIFDETEMRAKPTNPHQFTFTVRVRAWRDDDVMGEDRKAFAAHIDDDPDTGLLPGLPFDLLASGESSPVLYDLDGLDNGKLEIIFGTTDGNIEVFGWDDESGTWARRPGFPVSIRIGENSGTDLALASPSIGDLFGDGRVAIITATALGKIFAIRPEGNLHTNAGGDPDPFWPGFPYQVPEPDRTTPRGFGHGVTFAASPVLGDLDNDGVLEIIAANYNANIYAVTPTDANADGTADDAPGFPVSALSLDGAVAPDKVCLNENGEPLDGVQILGTPAVGIFDPTSSDPELSEFPSILVPTTEVCYDGGSKTGRLYLIKHDGNNAAESPFIEGWPLVINAPLADALPIPPLTSGITAAPAVAHTGDTTLVGTGAFFSLPLMLEIKDGEIHKKTLDSNLSVNVAGHGAFGKLAADGPLHYALPTTSAAKIVDGWISILRPLLMAWDTRQLSAPPVVSTDLDDIDFYINPIIADVNGDGLAEIIAGSSGFLLHALSPDGTEPAGWPKFTFNWIVAAAASGDLDNDGLLDIVLPTHEGKLFGWKTTGPACANGTQNGEWRRFHHDEYNSGYYGGDTTPPGVAIDFVKTPLPTGRTRLTWTSPGDDWQCGRAARYELRMGDDTDALATLEGFAAATSLDAPSPGDAGTTVKIDLAESASKHFAIRAIDDEGHLGHIVVASEDSSGDDDEDADTDTPALGDDDDDDDDSGCGC